MSSSTPIATPTRLPRHARLHRLRNACAWAVGATVLAVVFVLYTDPGFVVMMADQVWACF